MSSIQQSLSVTGFVLFLLGLVTLTPEVYLSGVIVMLTSAGITVKALEAQRVENSLEYETLIPNESYHSW